MTRKVYAQVPPKVEYSLTELGRTLEPVLAELMRWGASFMLSEADAPRAGSGRLRA